MLLIKVCPRWQCINSGRSCCLPGQDPSSILMVCSSVQDSLVQTVRQVQAAFETLLDILQLQTQVHSSLTHRQTAASELQTFLCSTSLTLLAIGKRGLTLHPPLWTAHTFHPFRPFWRWMRLMPIPPFSFPAQLCQPFQPLLSAGHCPPFPPPVLLILVSPRGSGSLAPTV